MVSPSFTVTAPGKIILHGEHAVVYGKKAVAAAIGLKTTLQLEATNDGQFTLNLLSFGTTCRWKAEELRQDVKRLTTDGSCWPQEGRELFNKSSEQSEVKVVDKRAINDAIRVFIFLIGKFVEEIDRVPSFSVEVSTSIPVGAGLGSSASYCVCLSTALLAVAGKVSQPSMMRSIPGDERELCRDEMASLSREDLELIHMWSLEAEKLVHGKPSGIDNSVCTYGAVLTFKDGTIEHLAKIPQLRVLITDTKVPRSTKDLVAGLRDRCQQLPSVYNPLFDAVGAVAEESCVYLEKLYQIQAVSPSAKENLQEQYYMLEKLIDLNQQLLVTLGVSHTSLDQVCRVTARHGLHSKLTGAGGGGCTYTLVTPGTSELSVTSVTEELTAMGFDVWDTCLGAQGVTLSRTPLTHPSQ
ncbi:mevalonate kinase-like [Stylophora pistillata]|uniref:Mevalonate kinase n=1 Tax=Stylophora pistillata TaxID=50429 RepID=A0A2B4SEE6_STYPI|nr:mevalonate kinase-like [Stylophora pistillata]XP_022787583.1 mevalonate kinase-like [Stylophora pistillata]PFX27413.1 Mevalonate kinase [Stylophora pistillata]